ncbi:DEAD/DEAH box helicase family protein [Roseobacter sp. EG26]|uniref:DEAD/DEAH box helicase family protein n=1 Tax=Roseobacter sp. EG26 TaxID=3412477 RepID=UPI003CE535C2
MSLFDFDKLSRPTSDTQPTDPVEVFRSASSLDATPNDLWRGQSQALEQWDKVRSKNDVLVSLHTGAGKSLVGIIIAQSLMNEGIQNVIYACATNDLVRQTKKECDERLGFRCSTRAGGRFSSEAFENGTGFCITNYQALFNSRCVFRGDLRPSAIIFDDAHVAEKTIRDCYTISIDRKKQKDAFGEFIGLVLPYFERISRKEFLAAILKGSSTYSCTAVPPGAVVELTKSGALVDWMKRHSISSEFAYGHLADKLHACSIFISRYRIEIAPAFLPAKRMDLLAANDVRRIYLSATLTSEVDFCRAFGKRPAVKIEPENDAGVGERLIIMRRRDQLKLDGVTNPEFTNLAANIAKHHKVLIASSSYAAADKYFNLVSPAKSSEFSASLEKFRQQTEPGAFSLVARVDGIDLPHGTCRVSIADGLPTGFSLCETYQFDCLEMRNAFAARIANRVVQLFGRTNRGRNDYSVIFSFDDRLIGWLNKTRNLALLPSLLQKQVELGRSLIDQLKIADGSQFPKLVDQVLSRDRGWLSYYKDTVSSTGVSEDEQEQALEIDAALLKGALAEANFAAAMWDGRPDIARTTLGEAIHEVAPADRRLAGWYSMHIGHSFECEGDSETASKHYADARARTFFDIALPQPSTAASIVKAVAPKNGFHASLLSIFSSDKAVAKNPWDKHEFHIKKLLADDASSNQHEEAMRLLGEVLGFVSSRPEQESDQNSTLDVLWLHEETKCAFLWSLKTKKNNDSPLNSEEVGTGLLHLEWFDKEFPDYHQHELFFLTPQATCVQQAHPSERMAAVRTENLRQFYRQLDQAMISLFKMPPADRLIECEAMSLRQEWQPSGIRKSVSPENIIRQV